MFKDALRPYVTTMRALRGRKIRVTDIGYAQRISYSQFGEDLWLADYFADQSTGFYVDVGAFDPFHTSNTLLLYRRGWHGINIEPDPQALARFRRFRPRDINLGVAINDTAGTAEFILDGAFSGIADKTHLWEENATTHRVTVETRTLSDVLTTNSVTEIDVLDVDCEGSEIRVLMSNDWTRFRPRVVLVEIHPGAPDDAARFLVGLGYSESARLDLTRVFVDG